MRTTLDLDPDIRLAVKDLSQRKNVSMGVAATELMRKALMAAVPANTHSRNGVLVFEPSQGAPIMSLETVNSLRDDE